MEDTGWGQVEGRHHSTAPHAVSGTEPVRPNPTQFNELNQVRPHQPLIEGGWVYLIPHTRILDIFFRRVLLVYSLMEKKVIYEKFNSLTGKWEKDLTTEAEWLNSMKVLDDEKEILDAELEIVNKIIEQHLNDPLGISRLVESKD